MGHDFCAPHDQGCPPPPLHCGEDQMPCMNPPPPNCPDCPVAEFCAPMDQGCPPPPPALFLQKQPTDDKAEKKAERKAKKEARKKAEEEQEEARADWLESAGGPAGVAETMEEMMPECDAETME